MRRMMFALLGLPIALASGDADAKSKKHMVQTGDLPPKHAKKNKACHDDGAIRFVGEGPSTPMAVVKNGRIGDAGQACCASWAKVGGRWKALDAHGQIVGDVEVAGAEGYDVTQCYEMGFRTKKGAPGVGVYVQGDYKAPKSPAWAPTDAEKTALAKLVADLEKAMVPSATYDCGDGPKAPLPFAERALFFTMPKTVEDAEGKVARWAVVGGPLLVVARLQKDGRWIARHTDAFGTNTCLQRAFRPRAVFDMNGDGRPEIVMHDDYGEAFGDFVLGLDPLGDEGKWEHVVDAVHGSTA